MGYCTWGSHPELFWLDLLVDPLIECSKLCTWPVILVDNQVNKLMRRRDLHARGIVEQESASNPDHKLQCAMSDNPITSFYYNSICFWNGIEGYKPKTLPYESACRHPPAAGSFAGIAATGSAIISIFFKIIFFTFPQELLKWLSNRVGHCSLWCWWHPAAPWWYGKLEYRGHSWFRFGDHLWSWTRARQSQFYCSKYQVYCSSFYTVLFSPIAHFARIAHFAHIGQSFQYLHTSASYCSQ